MCNFTSDVKQSKAENSDDDVYEKLTGKAAPGGKKVTFITTHSKLTLNIF